MMKNDCSLLGLLALLFAVGCGGGTVVNDGGQGGSGGIFSVGGATGDGETGTGGDRTGVEGSEYIPDHEALSACAVRRCEDGARVSRIESGSFESFVHMECILEAFRDRTPGVREVRYTHVWTNGRSEDRYTLHTTPSGEVEVSLYQYIEFTFGGGNNGPSETYVPTQRCVLKPPSFFESCLAGFGTGPGMPTSEVWPCIAPNGAQPAPWFESCVDQPPTCQ